jgi:hypothetical protein
VPIQTVAALAGPEGLAWERKFKKKGGEDNDPDGAT